MEKIKLLFVGAFREDPSIGAVGGTLTACRQLMASPFGAKIVPVFIDSTAPNPPHPFLIRTWFGSVRMAKVCLGLLIERPNCALIFATGGASWIEKGLMTLLCGLFGVPVVLAPRSMTAADDVARSAWRRRFTRSVFKSCAIVVVQSQRAKTRFLEAVPEAADIFRVRPNWIELGEYLQIPEPDAEANEVLNVLYLGWLVPVKGIDILVEAVNRHRKMLAGIIFVVCGGGTLAEDIHRRVHDLDLTTRFRFEGWVTGDAKLRMLKECDLLILPSRNEGMPNAVMEAMASGRPVIGTDVGGVKDLIGLPDRGYLIPSEDPDALAEALHTLAIDPERRRAMGRAARDYARDHLDVSIAWQDIYGFIEEAARWGKELQ